MCPQTREVQCLLQSMNNSPVKIKSNFQKKTNGLRFLRHDWIIRAKVGSSQADIDLFSVG